MPPIIESSHIQGVYTVQLKSFADDRGRFRESFRQEWFPQRSWDRVQVNCSYSAPHILRGLHYHHKQVDYWFVPHGQIRAALVDLRPFSPTYKHTQTILMGAEAEIGLFIPIGVAHGFVSLTQVTLMYVVDNYYDGHDELGVAWNDPTLAVAWGVENPIVSQRDSNNPLLSNIPSDKLPKKQSA